ncbi:hypothetical protein VNO77_02339 [Canavalia gladiata]|uniref:Uncharacterized protein n=1 Tax=Canavalia gladiata TaxID=3824 RepID=A0AAN9MY28_CANGL
MFDINGVEFDDDEDFEEEKENTWQEVENKASSANRKKENKSNPMKKMGKDGRYISSSNAERQNLTKHNACEALNSLLA